MSSPTVLSAETESLLSLVKSFLGLGCTITVWCCRPSSVDVSNSGDNHLDPPELYNADD